MEVGEHRHHHKHEVAGVSLLLLLMGNVMGKVKRNFFIGVRTPWALSDERVWNATHRFAGKVKVMVIMGLLGLVFTFRGCSGVGPGSLPF